MTVTTSVATLATADWDGVERDVVERIRYLKIIAQGLEPSDDSDRVARHLIMPNMRLLAQFCQNIEIGPQVQEPDHD